ncbi:MAG: hypothetical protein J7K69_08155 [Thermotogae bacterium]|nr:hypothetical protein [Thermotogota bacterium]
MEKKKKILFIFILFLILMCLNALSIQISVEKEEILSVDELHITSSNPDILKINNGLFIIEVLPNRGRVIWSVYPVSNTDENFIYFSKDPYILPFMDEITSQYFFELGGSYLSEPWNPRSNQPYPYEEYNVIQSDNEARVILEGMNPTENIRARVELIVRDNDSRISMNVTLQNLSKNTLSISVKEFTVFDLSTGFLTTDFSSLNEKRLDDFDEYKLINAKNLRFFGIKKGKYSLKKILENGYSNHYVQIWGKNWEEQVGGAPAVRLVDERIGITLKPNEKLSFKVLFEYNER